MHNATGLFKFEGEKVSGLNSRFLYRPSERLVIRSALLSCRGFSLRWASEPTLHD